ncbi:hypothetical protein ABID12_003693 [Martelella mangrovi]|uniref:Uncharacterized protein n=1 Tax=Martelella mangrovi TaxID=1397477 RepID=A0ABV2IFQ5_9HYPH
MIRLTAVAIDTVVDLRYIWWNFMASSRERIEEAKSSQSHLFWGCFDMAVTRFSGRRAPIHLGGILTLLYHVPHEAYDWEVSWPGGGGIDYPAFYAYPCSNQILSNASRQQ